MAETVLVRPPLTLALRQSRYLLRRRRTARMGPRFLKAPEQGCVNENIARRALEGAPVAGSNAVDMAKASGPFDNVG